jgi:hypothetical protein
MSDNPTYLAGRKRIVEGLRLAGVCLPIWICGIATSYWRRYRSISPS